MYTDLTHPQWSEGRLYAGKKVRALTRFDGLSASCLQEIRLLQELEQEHKILSVSAS